MMAKRNEIGSLFLLAALAAVIVVLAAQVKPAVAGTVYTTEMETCVRGIVQNPQKRIDLPGLIRLLFHDAFVRGLDGSVVLLETPFNTTSFSTQANLTGPTEQGSPSNGGLRGLEMIDEIREALFKDLKINVSCADCIAFAAREATYVLSKTKIKYDIDGPGRKDGVVSFADEPGNNLPGPTFTFDQLKGNFTAKNFTVTDLVALSGAHGIGDTHLLPFVDRLNPAIAVPPPGPNEIDLSYQGVIRNEAALAGNATRSYKNNIRDMGSTAVTNSGYVPNKVDMTAPADTLDNSFYNANLQNRVRFKSDWELRMNDFAAGLLVTFRDNPAKFYDAFKAAMSKLSNNVTAVGPRFEDGFRKNCTATNFKTQESYPLPKQ